MPTSTPEVPPTLPMHPGARPSSSGRSQLLFSNALEFSPASSQQCAVLTSPAAAPAPLYGQGDNAQELAHDARNFLTAVDLFCELLAAPGVLSSRFRHYAADLQTLGRTGVQLVARMAGTMQSSLATPSLVSEAEAAPSVELTGLIHPYPPIDDLGAELLALREPLQAIAGPNIRVEIECASLRGEIGLNSEALLRILFNLVANSVEAMQRCSTAPAEKLIRITAQFSDGASFRAFDAAAASVEAPTAVLISVHDNGPGIAAEHLPRIFEAGFSTRVESEPEPSPTNPPPYSTPLRSSGHGLAIVRRLIEATGGRIRTSSSRWQGTCFELELPLASFATGPQTLKLVDGNRTSSTQASANFQRISRCISESGV